MGQGQRLRRSTAARLAQAFGATHCWGEPAPFVAAARSCAPLALDPAPRAAHGRQYLHMRTFAPRRPLPCIEPPHWQSRAQRSVSSSRHTSGRCMPRSCLALSTAHGHGLTMPHPDNAFPTPCPLRPRFVRGLLSSARCGVPSTLSCLSRHESLSLCSRVLWARAPAWTRAVTQ
jgi:hypothetical protein